MVVEPKLSASSGCAFDNMHCAEAGVKAGTWENGARAGWREEE